MSTLVNGTAANAAEPHSLPSWNDGPVKQAVLSYVRRVSQEGSPDFVPEAERLAVFDNDGTLGFRTVIVSGGGADFMRVWAERVYGIPPEQVVGSTALTRFELRGDRPVLVKELDHHFVDDKGGKPVGIHAFLGQRPVAAFGNSDGDLQMLQ
ncbi:MAG: HAD family hydrolase, partial [Synechococcaceae cyanobacterium]|nr:HAD family hydrolase [Synechococcaceae cyanobacterium]